MFPRKKRPLKRRRKKIKLAFSPGPVYNDSGKGAHMVSVLDVARYILEQTGPTTTMKLQKLVYYCQAWSLAWDDEPLFDEEFQAWANGPVCPELFDKHRGEFRISESKLAGYNAKLTDAQRETVRKVLAYYGDKEPHWLGELTHLEGPWRDARLGVPMGEPSSNVIEKDSMQQYYGGLSRGEIR